MRLFFFPAILVSLTAVGSAQLLQPGDAIPKTATPPVVFLNGYQSGCTGSGFQANFGNADKVLQNNQIVSLFFDNCTIPNKPSLEALGNAFGQFISSLKYTDGSAVPQVDVVAHSMGGLIVRTYLAGKQDTNPATYTPPAAPAIRKAIFLATPHFGTAVANLLGGFGFQGDRQTGEMSLGSQFLFDLNSWNQGTDDLRGIDAIAVSGNPGTGIESGTKNFDDGVVALTSSSIAFARPGRTRVIPYCHTADPLVFTFGACPSGTPATNQINDASSLSGQIIVSFLTGTTAWQSIGTAVEADPVASTRGGVTLEAQDQTGVVKPISNATVGSAALNVNETAYSESLPAPATTTAVVQPISGPSITGPVTLKAATSVAVVEKTGPIVKGVVTAGSIVFPLNVAADGYVAVYGSNLATSTQTASVPYPTQLADVQVLVNGNPAQIQFISSGQLNIVYPHVGAGLTTFTVKNAAGQHTVNVLVAPAVPSIFTLDGSNNGPAAALDASLASFPVVGTSAPLHAGDYVELYVTGLGATTQRADGLNWAQIQPTVKVGGQTCNVTFAGIVPGFTGFDQINCVVPAGVIGSAVPVVVTSNGRDSNTATLAIQ